MAGKRKSLGGESNAKGGKALKAAAARPNACPAAEKLVEWLLGFMIGAVLIVTAAVIGKMSQDANLESSQVSNHCGACWWCWQIFEQAAELRGKLRPVSVSHYLLVLLFVHLP